MSLLSKKSFVGLDLGHFSIKAVQVERHAGGWKVTKYGSIPTPPSAIKDGVVVDQEPVAAAVKALLKEHHIHATTANIGVAGGTVIVRPVKIPKMPESTLRKSIKFEASRYVPSTVEDSFIDFEIVGDAPDNQMEVLFVAAPKDIVSSRVEACKLAGLEVDAVDVDAFASYRVLIEANPDPEGASETFALVDIGAAATNLSVISHGAFAMTRSIPHGGNALTEALKSYFKLSVEDAESGKAQLNFSDLITEAGPKENPPLRVLQSHIDDLVREIRRSLNYFQSQQSEGKQGTQIDRVILTGGGANMIGLTDYVEHKLTVRTIAAGVFDNPRFVHAGDEVVSGRELAVASGLAMRAHSKAA